MAMLLIVAFCTAIEFHVSCQHIAPACAANVGGVFGTCSWLVSSRYEEVLHKYLHVTHCSHLGKLLICDSMLPTHAQVLYGY